MEKCLSFRQDSQMIPREQISPLLTKVLWLSFGPDGKRVAQCFICLQRGTTRLNATCHRSGTITATSFGDDNGKDDDDDDYYDYYDDYYYYDDDDN